VTKGSFTADTVPRGTAMQYNANGNASGVNASTCGTARHCDAMYSISAVNEHYVYVRYTNLEAYVAQL